MSLGFFLGLVVFVVIVLIVLILADILGTMWTAAKTALVAWIAAKVFKRVTDKKVEEDKP